jgi:cold shock CspA family protein
MKKRNYIKKEVKKIKKAKDSKINKRRNQIEPDLWKEIRSNLKPLSLAYNKFREKRRVAKQKEEERRLKEENKQRLREQESLRLQEQEERRFKKEKKIKEEEERRLKTQEKKRLEEKRIIEERDKQIRQEQNYRERLVKGEVIRIEQLKRANELREEERKLREERSLRVENSFIAEQRIKDEEQQRLKDKEQRLKEEEQRLKDKEQRLKEKEQRLKEEETINLKEGIRSDDGQSKKRLNGSVKWYNDAKGYGFIKREDKEKDVYVHCSAVQNSSLKYLEKGEKLTFEVEYLDKGPSAFNLQKAVNEVLHPHLKVVK